jgi:hypothetical protein
MSGILDIDLDYFNMVKAPEQRLRGLLSWAGRPVSIVVERHHHALREWRRLEASGLFANPGFILHVDEHHDMMDESDRPNIANVMYHAMRLWPTCRVIWITAFPIDSPAMWLSEEAWSVLEQRFSVVREIPANFPKPDLVSVTTSPDFVPDGLAACLSRVIGEYRETSKTTHRSLATTRCGALR